MSQKDPDQARKNHDLNISYYQSLLKEEDRLLVDSKVSLVQVDDGTLACSQAAAMFTNCLKKKGERDECQMEFLLYAMCKMKQETQMKGNVEKSLDGS